MAQNAGIWVILAMPLPLWAQPSPRNCTAAATPCLPAPAVSHPGASLRSPAWKVLPRDWKNPFDAPPALLAPGSAPLIAWMRPAAWGSGQDEPPQAASRPTSKKKKPTYSKSPNAGSPGHIFWVVPAFKVNYAGQFKPLTPKEKFQEWAESAYDPLGLAAGAVEAGTLEYSSSDGFCGYGLGLVQYLQCFGSLQLDALDSSFFGDYVFTVWWHQDPRYFRLGKGGFAKRTLYAISRVFVTYNDQGKNVFYSSALAGTGMAAVVSNTYYPPQDRGVGLTLSRIGIDLGNTALYNGAAEFWPDIDGWLDKTF